MGGIEMKQLKILKTAEIYHKSIARVSRDFKMGNKDKCIRMKVFVGDEMAFQYLYYDPIKQQHYHINEYEDGRMVKRYLPAKNFDKREKEALAFNELTDSGIGLALLAKPRVLGKLWRNRNE